MTKDVSAARNFRQALGNVGIFSAFLAVSLIAGSRIPLKASSHPSFQELIGEHKIRYIDRHISDFNIVFAGSSLTASNFSPVVFDRQMKEEGFDTLTFNLGRAGDRGHQTDFLVRNKILNNSERTLDILVLELRPYDDTDDPFRYTRRDIAWHTPYQTTSILRTLYYSNHSERMKRIKAWAHVKKCLLKYVPLGRLCFEAKPKNSAGALSLESLDFIELKLDEALHENRGYIPYQLRALYGDDNIAKRNRYFRSANGSSRFRKKLATLKAGLGDETNPALHNRRALLDIITSVQKAGIIPVIITYPSTHNYGYLSILEDRAEGVRFLKFDSPAEYEWAYDPEYRLDAAHLNDKGTARLSKLIAERFAAEILARDEGLNRAFAIAPQAN